MPEELWHKEKYPDDYPFSMEPLVGGVGNGLVDEVTSTADLIMGLSMFGKEVKLNSTP